MAAPQWYTQGDKDIFKDNQFITQEKYRVGPYTPTVKEDELTMATGSGIPYTHAFTGAGGDNARPSFNYQSDRNYLPGGMYERNPQASGALNTVMNAQGQIVPNTRFGAGTHLNDPTLDKGDYLPNIRPGYSQFSPLELSYMSELPQSGQDLSRMQKLQMMARDFKGVDSAYENYRTKGKLGEWAKTGVGMIPWLSQGLGAAANMLGLEMTGDKSDRQRWAVDGAGFGQGTGRDQFGVYTGGKTLMGDTANYKERMEQKVKDIKKFFKDDPSRTNSTLSAQLKDYEIKLGILDEDEKVNMATQKNIRDKRSRDYYRREKVRKQTGEQGIYGLHQDEGKAKDDLKAAPAKTVYVAGPQSYHQGPDTPSGDGGNWGAAPGTPGGWDPGAKKDGGRVPFFYGGLAGIL